MRYIKGMVAGAFALGGLVFAQGEASARPLAAPELINVSTASTDTASGTQTLPCYYGWHHGWRHGGGWGNPYYRHWGWRRHYWHPAYYGGWRRHWGWHHRYYGWHRHWGWHHGWHRW